MIIEITTQNDMHVFYCRNSTVVQGIAPYKQLNEMGFFWNAANQLDNEWSWV